jgi:predicted transcriptional regulator
MRILWERPSLPVRDVVEALPGRRARAYTTIMTVMNRLTEKRLLERRPDGRAFVYTPTVSEEEFVERLTRSMVRSLINDFGDIAVANFVGELRETDPGEFQRLRELVEREENEPGP